jgi:hypothetical protein
MDNELIVPLILAGLIFLEILFLCGILFWIALDDRSWKKKYRTRRNRKQMQPDHA